MKQFSKELGKVSVTPKGAWNINTTNERLDIVYDKRNNQAYIAKQNVPVGVDIDNREYWQPMNVTGYADNNFINLTTENENGTITAYESLEEAVATILPINRRVGATLSFYNLNSDRLDRQAEFELWQFNSTDLANWENKNYWNNIYYNWNVFVGWYVSVDSLENHVKMPNVGQYAYVGTNLNDALLYQCRTNGTWTNTGIKVRNYISVVVSGNITIGENGNWFNDGNDTGIPATPAVDEQLDDIIIQLQQHTTEISNLKKSDANLQDQITSNASDITSLTAKYKSLSKTVQDIVATGGASTTTNVTYNNDTSRLNAENAQDAIDELQGSKIDKTSILQVLGEAEDKVMSQKASKRIFRELSNKASSNCFVLVDDYYVDGTTKLPKYYVGDSNYRCLYANLLPNRSYTFEYTSGLRTINFYNGTIDNATLVESKIYDGGISTPYVYDFCLISVDTYYNEYVKYHFYENKSVTSEELANGSVTAEKLDSSARTNTIPLSLDIDAVTEEWESGILDESGNILENALYCVSPFIDYSGVYNQKQILQFKSSSPYSYNNVCIYSREKHEFIGSLTCLGNDNGGVLSSIIIYSGLSIRVCTIKKLANWYKLGNTTIKDAFIRNEPESVTTDKLLNKSVTTDKLADSQNFEKRTIINLSAENTTLKNGVYDSRGFIENTDTSNFQSILYSNISNYNRIDISNYTVDVSGGAFLDSDENVLKAFSSASGADHVLVIPKDAVTIAITVSVYHKYHDIYGITTLNDYYLNNLHVKTSQLEYDKPLQKISNNQWYGKKLCIIGTSVAHGSNAETAYGYIAQQKLGFTMIPAGVPGQAIHGKTVTYMDSVVQKTILSPLTYGSGSLTKEEYAAAKAVKDAGLSSDVVGMTISEAPNNPTDWAGESKAYNNYYRTWENLFTAENQDVALWIYATVPNNTNFNLDDWNKFDTSNWRYNDGTSFDKHRTTFLGAMLYLMDKMYENQPKARMILVLDSAFGYGDNQGKGNMELLSKTFNIPLIDLWSKTNTCPKSKLQILSKEGKDLHPSTFGHEVMGDIFTNELLLVR